MLILAIFTTSASGDIVFSDDFESGTLDQWTIGGRQQGVSNVSEVISRHGSQMAHLYHKRFTEITMEKTFDYYPNLNFSFDMEAYAVAINPVTNADYAMGGVGFSFRNISGDTLGQVRYIHSNSSWPFDTYNPNPTHHSFAIADDAGLVSYNLNVQDLLSNIDVDSGSIASVKLQFIAYTSGLYYSETSNNMYADVWVDNVTVVCELPTLEEIEIVGPEEVAENFNASYKAIAHYEDDSTKDVTDLADWLVEPNSVASIEAGLLTTEEIYVPQEDITIYAQYTEGNVTVEAEKEVLVFAICPSGSALSFDGVDDYVNLDAHIGDYQDLSTGTLSVWIKKESTGSAGIFFSSSDGGDTYSSMYFAKMPDEKIKIRISQNDTSKLYWNSDSVLPFGWHHFAYTTDSSGHCAYLDGVPLTGSYTVGSPSTSAFFSHIPDQDTMRIGNLHNRNKDDWHWNGLIDEVAIFNRALSAEEIRANMHKRLSGDEPGLVGYWDFDEGEGQIVYDLSGNGNHGQLGSTPNADDSDPAWVDSDALVGICTYIAFDIKPGSCPNPLNLNSQGVLPAAILGTEELAVSTIDATSVRLADVAAIRHSYEDVAGLVSDANECECTEEGPDGYTDLTLKFRTQEIVEQLIDTPGQLADGQTLVLNLSGELFDDRAIVGSDCVVLVGNVPRWLAAKGSDINGDGVVNMLDFAELANYWLESCEIE